MFKYIRENILQSVNKWKSQQRKRNYKKNQMDICELKNTISGGKKSLDKLNRRLDVTNGRVYILENRSVEIIQAERIERKSLLKTEQNLMEQYL